VLAGSAFAMFADVELACARLGINPEHMEIWEVATALGAHRHEPSGPRVPIGGVVMDDMLSEMVHATLAEQAGGPTAQWN
jgi:hypothetical protein